MKRQWKNAFVAFGFLLFFLLTACTPKETIVEFETSDGLMETPEQTPNPTVVDPGNLSSPDELMVAFLACLETGEWETAGKYIWPFAEKYAGYDGDSVQSIFGGYETLGYGTLDRTRFSILRQNEKFTLYEVEFIYTDATSSESVEIEEITIVDQNGRYYVSVDNLLCGYEVGALEMNEEEANPDETPTTDAQPDTAPVEEEGQTQEDAQPQTEEAEQPETEDAEAEIAEQRGVFARVVRAASHANGFSLWIEIENITEEAIIFGSGALQGGEALIEEENEPEAEQNNAEPNEEAIETQIIEMSQEEAMVVLEGVSMTNDEFASAELASMLGLTSSGPSEGALDSWFDTFAGNFTVEPGETTVCEVYFAMDIQVIYAVSFRNVMSEGETRVLPVGWEVIVPIEGGLDLRNPFGE